MYVPIIKIEDKDWEIISDFECKYQGMYIVYNEFGKISQIYSQFSEQLL